MQVIDRSKLRAARLLGAVSLAALAAVGARAQDTGATSETAQAAENAAEAAAEGDAIIVTGFRASLDAALDIKRDSVSSVDAIVAEDIAKFPDQNLAESLQRIPGISIQRDGGEGRSITVRGLGAQFTRVRVNGMETIATSNDGAASNRDRGFDFNVFASELFNSIVVHKTAEASLDEGSLGAVVDLNTGNPLAGKYGLTVVGSAQASYNDLSENVGPRLAGLISWKNDDGTFGASISAAYQTSDTLELGNNSVRWVQTRFDSVGGTRCYTTQNAGGSPVANAPCNEAALAFHPRIPRYGEVAHDRERLGVTAGLQWAPSDATKVSLDALFSSFAEDREEKWGEVLLRSNERSIDVVNYAIDPATNNMVSATLNDAWVRTEHFLKSSETEFYQLGATVNQDLSDSFRIRLLGGLSESDADVPVETTFIFDDRDAQGYHYDYTDMARPQLAFGTSVTDPAVFQLAEIRDRPSNVTNKFRTVQLSGEWDVIDDVQLQAGGVWRKFTFDTVAFTRDTVVCGNGGLDRVLGTLACSPSSAFGPAAVYGFPAGSLGELFDIGKGGQPSGTTTQFLVPNIAAAADFTNLYERTPAVDASNTRGVVEEVTGGFLQLDVRGDLFGMEAAANAGLRYVYTDQSSDGLSSGVPVTVERNYDDWLPSINFALFPSEDLVLRAAMSKVITRPTLGNLTPGGTVDGFNYRVTFGNPFLDPFRATAYDVALEWYFAPEAIASVALFRKDIASFPLANTRSGTFASTGLPTSIIPPSSPAAINPEGQLWTINSITNGTGAKLNGVELALQTPFFFLPGVLQNFGGIVNATLVDSEADYLVAGPAKVPGGPLINETRTSTLFGLAEQAFNATLYYEDSKFSARASVSYRSDFVDANSATGNVFEGYGSILNVDASMRYRVTEHIELSLEGVNLTDEYRYRWTDVDERRNYENNHFGRTFLVGARFEM